MIKKRAHVRSVSIMCIVKHLSKFVQISVNPCFNVIQRRPPVANTDMHIQPHFAVVPANTHSLGWAHDRPAAIDSRSEWCRRLALAAIMFVARSIAADHKDLIHDVSYDFHGRRMATCSSDQSVKVLLTFTGYRLACVSLSRRS